MDKPCIVLDTNVLISAALFQNSKTRQAFNRAIAIGKIVASQETLAELEEVLNRHKFDKYVSSAIRNTFLIDFQMVAELVEITEKIDVCRDTKDNKFLELSASAEANYLITGDEDLLVLHPFRETSILSPAEFIKLF